MTDDTSLDQYQRRMKERVIARRATIEEFSNYIGGLDYLDARILTKSGIELFVGVKEFAESIRAFKEGGE